MIKLIETETYRKTLEEIRDRKAREAIERKVEKLKENPELGKPMMHQHIHLWELRIGKYRVFYIIKKGEIDLLVILMMAAIKKEVDGNYQKYVAEIEQLLGNEKIT